MVSLFFIIIIIYILEILVIHIHMSFIWQVIFHYYYRCSIIMMPLSLLMTEYLLLNLLVPSCDVRYDSHVKRCLIRLDSYLFCMGFMCYLCYLHLFTYTGVQHDFYIRWCSCPLTVTQRESFFCCPWCCLSFLYLRLLITPYVFLNFYHSVATRYWFLCYSVAYNMSPSLCAYVLFSEGTNFNFKLFGFQTFRLWMYLMKVIPETRRAH